jgi:thioredoxin-like negative regulator of GroEL
MNESGALLVLFGGKRCGVCQSIKPRIEQMIAEQFPEVELRYIDCEQEPELCAQQGVFSLPVVKFFIDGQVYLELARNFSFSELAAQLERLVRLWKQAT